MEGKKKYGWIGPLVEAWKNDYVYKTLIGAGFSFVCTVLFPCIMGIWGYCTGLSGTGEFARFICS